MKNVSPIMFLLVRLERLPIPVITRTGLYDKRPHLKANTSAQQLQRSFRITVAIIIIHILLVPHIFATRETSIDSPSHVCLARRTRGLDFSHRSAIDRDLSRGTRLATATTTTISKHLGVRSIFIYLHPSLKYQYKRTRSESGGKSH